MKEVVVKNGNNKISLGMSEMCYCTYIQFDDNPLTVIFDYYLGEAGSYKFHCNLPHNDEYRKLVNAQVPPNLNLDFTDRSNELYDFLKPLLSKLKNGLYRLNFFSNNRKEYFISKSASGTDNVLPFEVIFADEITDISKIRDVEEKYEMMRKSETPYLIDYEFYYVWGSKINTNIPMYGHFFYSTIPKVQIDSNRIIYFEEKINNGERPIVIILRGYNQDDEFSPDYILDGHHKLIAYKKLNIYPPIVLITYFGSYSSEVEFNINKLEEILYPWEVKQALKYMEEEYIIECRNTKKHLYRAMRNGFFQDFFENGKLKHEVTYKNGYKSGIEKEWYSNGNLKASKEYKLGIQVGIWKHYFENGKLKLTLEYDNNGKCIDYKYEN